MVRLDSALSYERRSANRMDQLFPAARELDVMRQPSFALTELNFTWKFGDEESCLQSLSGTTEAHVHVQWFRDFLKSGGTNIRALSICSSIGVERDAKPIPLWQAR